MTDRLVAQPSAAPTRKLTYGAAWGIAVAILMALVEAIRPDLAASVQEVLDAAGPFVPALLESGVPVVVGAAAAYWTKARASEAGR